MDIYKISRLNYYKILKAWWTNDVDGDCICFNLYRKTENSIILLKKGKEISEKKSTARFIDNVFLIELTQIEWSVSKKNNKMEEPMKQKLKIRNIILITVLNLIQKNSRFVRISFNRLSKFERLPVVYNTIYQKESDKIVYFGYCFFHWLDIEQIEKVLIVISK